ncbi:MAG: hypothetical protein FD166_2714 [Bacteroidetes bacterium]|nr:MAG: hypothetical protein FD166_2714 [Bacteroidota bacterium]
MVKGLNFRINFDQLKHAQLTNPQRKAPGVTNDFRLRKKHISFLFAKQYFKNCF